MTREHICLRTFSYNNKKRSNHLHVDSYTHQVLGLKTNHIKKKTKTHFPILNRQNTLWLHPSIAKEFVMFICFSVWIWRCLSYYWASAKNKCLLDAFKVKKYMNYHVNTCFGWLWKCKAVWIFHSVYWQIYMRGSLERVRYMALFIRRIIMWFFAVYFML